VQTFVSGGFCNEICLKTGKEQTDMLQKFYPHHEADSAYEIDYEGLYRAGFRGVVFDIDNTLVPHGAPADKRAAALVTRLQDCGFHVMFLSNNKEPRVKQFSDAAGGEYIYKAGKPKRAGYFKAMERLGTGPADTMFVGDQLFTDIWGAKKAGMETWLVKPIHPKEEIQIVLKRKLERIVLYFYHRKKTAKNRPVDR